MFRSLGPKFVSQRPNFSGVLARVFVRSIVRSIGWLVARTTSSPSSHEVSSVTRRSVDSFVDWRVRRPAQVLRLVHFKSARLHVARLHVARPIGRSIVRSLSRPCPLRLHVARSLAWPIDRLIVGGPVFALSTDEIRSVTRRSVTCRSTDCSVD